MEKKGLVFYVKWAGWASTSNTWEPTENLTGDDGTCDALKQYLLKNKLNLKHGNVYDDFFFLCFLVLTATG